MTFEDHTVEDFERLFAVNVRGVFLGCKHAVMQFKEQGGGGVIVNTGSVAGLVGWGGTVYGATKGAVHQLTRAVAVECAPFGIRVNAICPAAMPFTGLHGRRRRADRPERRLDEVGRAGRARSTRSGGRSPPRTAPRPRVFLASDRAAEHHRRARCRSTAGTWPDERVSDLDRCSTASGSGSCSTCAAAYNAFTRRRATTTTRTRAGTSCGSRARARRASCTS